MGETQVPANPKRVVTLDTGDLGNALALGIQLIASTFWFGEKAGMTPFEPYLNSGVNEFTYLGAGFCADRQQLGDRAAKTQVSIIFWSPSVMYLMFNESFSGTILKDLGLSRPQIRLGTA